MLAVSQGFPQIVTMTEPDEISSSSQSTLAFTESKRGVPILLHSGYEHSIKRVNKNKSTSWRCVNRNCHGGMLTDGENRIITLNKHDVCTPSESKNIIKQELFRCKKEAVSSQGKPIPSIYSESLVKLNDQGINLVEPLPKLSQVKSGLYNARNRYHEIKKTTFKNVLDVEIPKDYKKFLLFDYFDKKTRILGFADEKFRESMHHIKDYLGDGTFKCVVKPFKQLYVIYGDIGSTGEKINVVPVMYILLMDKKQSTYETMFALIKSQIPSWEPCTFRTDYEKAAMNAIENIFPNVTSKGCYFHFTKALWKKAKTLDLKKKKIFRKHVALCSALALLPSELRSDGFMYIMEDCPKNNNIEKFNDYFVTNWLDNDFMKGKWNFHNDIYRTNNPAEGANSRLNKTFKGRLNIITFLKTIKNDANINRGRLQGEGTIRRQETVDMDKYIQQSITSMLHGTISLGHCLEKICPFVF